MNDRERLIELIGHEVVSYFAEKIADHLIANGVTFQKHGRLFTLDECANEGLYCSICHKKVYKVCYANRKIRSKYCPNCGAKMDADA